MSLSLDMLQHPRVLGARDRAVEILERWRLRGCRLPADQARVDAVLTGSYDTCDLHDAIALELLSAAGWDYDLAEALMDRRTRGAPLSDVLAAIDTALALPEFEREAMFERITSERAAP